VRAIDGITARIIRYGFAPISEHDKETFLSWCIYNGIPFADALKQVRGF
jgi:hypothetical protein